MVISEQVATSGRTARRRFDDHGRAQLAAFVAVIVGAFVATGCGRQASAPAPTAPVLTVSLAATPAAATPRSSGATSSGTSAVSVTSTAMPSASRTADPTSTPDPALRPVHRLTVVTQLGGTTRAIAAMEQTVLFGIGMRVAVADVSDPDAPRVVGRSVPLRGIVNAIAVDGATAWAATSDGTLYSLALVDGQQPAVVGAVELPGTPKSLAAREGRVFVAAGTAGLVSVDGRDPAQPMVSSTLGSDEPAPGYGDRQEIVLMGDVLWLSDGLAWGGRGALYAIDVSTPDQLTRLGDSQDPADHMVAAGPDRLLMDRGDIQLLDVRDPTHPAVIGTQRFGTYRISALAVVGHRTVIVTETEPPALMSLDLQTMSPENDMDIADHWSPAEQSPGQGPMALAGKHVYVAEYGGGFDIVHVRPQGLDWRGSVADIGHVRAVTASGEWAYAVDRRGLTAWDVTDPSHPAARGSVYLPQWYPDLSILDGADPPIGSDEWATTSADRLYFAGAGAAVVASGITTDYFGGSLTAVSIADPDQLEVLSDTQIMNLGGHVTVGRHVFASVLGPISRVLDYRDPRQPRRGPESPYAVVVAVGNRGAAVAPEAPNVLAMIDLTRPEQPRPLGHHTFADAVRAVAFADDEAYVLTSGRAVHLHVLEGVTRGTLRQTGWTVVDPLAHGVTPAPGGALVTFSSGSMYAPQHSGVQLVTVDPVGQPRVADVLELPGRAFTAAVVAPYAYVAADAAGLVVLRIERIGRSRP